MGRLSTLAMVVLLGATYPHVVWGKELSYALIVLPKAAVNMALVQSVQQGLTRVATNVQGLQVKLPDEVNRLLKDDARHALVECHGDFTCIGGIAPRAGSDALMLARVAPSTIVDGGIVVQFLIINKAGHGVERKAAIELGDAADVDIALRASFLSLFGMPLRGGPVKGPLMAFKFDKKGQGDKAGKGDEELSDELDSLNTRVEELELSLATLDASQGVTVENLDVLDSLVTASQALMAQLQGIIEQMDAAATPRWLRARPKEVSSDTDGRSSVTPRP